MQTGPDDCNRLTRQRFKAYQPWNPWASQPGRRIARPALAFKAGFPEVKGKHQQCLRPKIDSINGSRMLHYGSKLQFPCFDRLCTYHPNCLVKKIEYATLSTGCTRAKSPIQCYMMVDGWPRR